MADRQVAVRMPAEMIAALDQVALRMAQAAPGIAFTRSDAARSVLTSALHLVGPELPRDALEHAPRATAPEELTPSQKRALAKAARPTKRAAVARR